MFLEAQGQQLQGIHTKLGVFELKMYCQIGKKYSHFKVDLHWDLSYILGAFCIMQHTAAFPD